MAFHEWLRWMSDNDEIIREFLIESSENLDQLDHDLLELEKDPASQEILGSIFRTIHTIKGTTGFLGFPKLESVTHSGENLLGLLRDGKLSLTPDVTSGLLMMVDAVRQMLGAIEKSRTDGESDYATLIEVLQELQSAQSANAPDPPDENESEAVQIEPSAAPMPLGQILVKSGQVSKEQLESALEAQQAGDPRHLGEILVERGSIPHIVVKKAIEQQKKTQVPLIVANTVRVDVSHLDKLIDLVGKLVLARNQIMQFCATQRDIAFLGASQRLNLITTELQEEVMKIRMQPIDTVWRKLPRMVRDLAVSCGKQVRVEMEGKETELDKTVIEAIKDPLTHVVRNSIDHGIEAPDRRLAAGKSAEGCLSLHAFHEGGQVIIQIADDGAGIDIDRVKQKAVERGLVTAEQAAVMKERESLKLIFLPGFSTAAKVTKVSGRGVGMDVVQTNIEKIGGTVDIQSEPGLGTTLKIKIPLTLAIIPALIVTSGGDRYAIPQISLLEMVRLEGDEAGAGIELVQGAPVYRLRGNLLSLVYLNRELKLPHGSENGATAQDVVNIVVLQADNRRFGLVVDEVNDAEEILVKPLRQHLKELSLYTGATVMGDGRVALILDVVALAQRAHPTPSSDCNETEEESKNSRSATRAHCYRS